MLVWLITALKGPDCCQFLCADWTHFQPILLTVVNFLVRDKKARRAEKHKGKGARKEEETGKSARQGSPNATAGDQDNDDIIAQPPAVPEEVCPLIFDT